MMASKLVRRFATSASARLLYNSNHTFLRSLHHTPFAFSVNELSPSLLSPFSTSHRMSGTYPYSSPGLRFFSTGRSRHSVRSKPVDIGARARQLQNRRLWTYALTFSCVAGFIIIVLNQFQDQLVFYLSPTATLEKFAENPSKNKFRLGGLVLEGSLAHPASSPEMEFVVTDLVTDVLVRYKGSLPDLFREGHSVVVEGFIEPLTDDIRKEISTKAVSEKSRAGDCYFRATEVLAKHDEKYMPEEIATVIEKNKKMIESNKGAKGETVNAA